MVFTFTQLSFVKLLWQYVTTNKQFDDTLMTEATIIITTNTLLAHIRSIRNLIDNVYILSHVCDSGCTAHEGCRKLGTNLGLAGRE